MFYQSFSVKTFSKVALRKIRDLTFQRVLLWNLVHWLLHADIGDNDGWVFGVVGLKAMIFKYRWFDTTVGRECKNINQESLMCLLAGSMINMIYLSYLVIVNLQHTRTPLLIVLYSDITRNMIQCDMLIISLHVPPAAFK